MLNLKSYIPVEWRGWLGQLRLYVKGWLLRDPQARDVVRWRRDQGDSALRLNYPLLAEDVVFDLGAFIGDFAAAIRSKYRCTVYLFEPVQSFFLSCQSRFASEEKIYCFNYGLSSSPQTLRISLDGDASSIARDATGQNEIIRLEQFDQFLNRFDIQEVALLKLNIEGGEYDVLENLIETGNIAQIRHLQVQFHDFFQDAVARRDRIRIALTATHRQDWCYHFVWESWTRL